MNGQLNSTRDRIIHMENRMDAVLLRQPTISDPTEVRIRRVLLENLVSTPWAKEVISRTVQIQRDFFLAALANINKEERILSEYQKTMIELVEATKTHLVQGGDILNRFKGGRSLIVIINHLGLAKLTRIPTNQLGGLTTELKEIEPFPIRAASVTYVFGKPERFHETAVELPYPFGKIQGACGGLIVAAEGEGRTQKLIDDVSRLLQDNHETLVVMYPEGGTSGKRNNGGPYDLDRFHTGTFVVAASLEIPIIPVCQIFDPKEGLKIAIIDPINLSKKDLPRVGEIAKETQEKMQDCLHKNISRRVDLESRV